MGKVNAPSMVTLQPPHPRANRQAEGWLAADSWSLRETAQAPVEKTSLAYVFLCCFVLIYWARPNYWVPGAIGIPFAKISGALAIASFFLWFVLERKGALFLPRELAYLLLLYLQLCLAIPFSIWPGGSVDVVILEYSKVVLVTVVAMMTITSLSRLRKLVFIQTVIVTLMTALAVSGYGQYVRSAYGQRLGGMFGGTYANPNDFALDMAMVFPFAFAFLLATRNLVSKALWFLSMGLIVYAVLLTYSRGGFIALLAAGAVVMWEFTVKGKRLSWILLLILGAAALGIFSGPAGYGNRLATIFSPNDDVSGSAQDRRVVLNRGVSITLQRPLWGVGPGNFGVISGSSDAHDWHGTHDTYLQLSSEAGLPALLLFLILLKVAFSSVSKAMKLSAGDAKLMLFAGALRASLVSLMVGALFADVAYHFFPYFLIGFASVLPRIAQSANGAEAAALGAAGVKTMGHENQHWLEVGRQVSPS